ncbi:hypothetical protein MFRU_015g00430 [Monilinia fructicola]|nr:hypothetical protein MFRU_015g00430 [Monilinia fructicola]
MLISNLFMTVGLGALVSARAVEKSDRLSQQPINDPPSPGPKSSSQSCVFTPSLPMPPTSFISTLPTSLHHHLPNILISHSFFSSNFPPSTGSKLPIISTLSLAEETGDSSLQGIFLGLVYTPIHEPTSQSPSTSLTEHKKSQPKPKPRCRRPLPTPVVNEKQKDVDKSWGHINNHEIRSPISSGPQSIPNTEIGRCYMEAVEGVRGSGLVEGTLEFANEGGRMRFLVWRVD